MRTKFKGFLYVLLCVALVVSAFPNIALGDTATVGRPASQKVLTFDKWKVAPQGAISGDSLASTAFTFPAAATDIGNTAAPSFNTASWLEIPVPGTLLGGLIDLGAYDEWFVPNNEGELDVMFHDNITKPRNDFDVPWWYSAEFDLTAAEAADFATLTFRGISYTGRVFVNGTEVVNTRLNVTNEDELRNRRVGTADMRGVGANLAPPYSYADPDPVAIPPASTANRGEWDDYKNTLQGSFRHYDLDATGLLVEGKNNIKVLVTRGDRNNDFNYNFHDWHMTPVDRNMGITYPVTLTLSGAVKLSSPLASSKVATNLNSATVSFFVEATNNSSAAVLGRVNAVVRDPNNKVIKTFSSSNVTIPAGANYQEIVLPPQTFSGADLKLWWPFGSGDQPLYHVDYEFVVGGATVTDRMTHRFGIREFGAVVNRHSRAVSDGANMMQVLVNHKPIVIKGGGFCPYDLYLRDDKLKDRAVVDLVKMAGFNCIRDEGKFFNDNMYDIMDEEGILLMTGYMCCDRNEARPNNWAKVERFIVYEQTYDQIRSLRAHPSAFMWLNGSDYPKDTSSNQNENSSNIATKMLEIEGRVRWYEHGVIMISAVNSRYSVFTGASGGMEMDHTYDSASPAFIFGSVPDPSSTGTISGTYRGMFNFISEGMGGAAFPSSLEGINRMIPTAMTWPFNEGHKGAGEGPGAYSSWNYHANRGGGSFTQVDIGVSMADGAIGGAESIEEWIKQSNLFQYELQRAQYEALNQFRYVTATGFINWMLNGTRPVIMWNQFDYDMNPNGATHGASKANEPVHIMYDPVRKKVSVINSTFEDLGALTATMVLYDINGNVISEKLSKYVNVVADALGPRQGGFVDRPVGRIPQQRNGDDWYEKAFDLYTYSYGNSTAGSAQVLVAPGVNQVWDSAAIQASLIRPTTDVYFMRLELAKRSGEVISYNTYAIPRRQDVYSGTSGWSRSSVSQTLDWTQLKQLPKVDLDIVVNNDLTTSADGIYQSQTVKISNNTDAIAHGIELQAFRRIGDVMLCPALYDDNMITLFPGQTRTITITHQKAYHDGLLQFRINSFNNLIESRPDYSGNVYLAADPVGQTATSETTNLARARQTATGDSTTFAASNATTIASTALNNANNGTTVIDSDSNTSISIAATGEGAAATGTLTVDLGSAQKFNRTMLRFHGTAGGSTMMVGTPNRVNVQVSSNLTDWTNVVTYDHSNNRAPMANIGFDTVEARYVRYNFTGLTTASTALGAGPGSVSSQNGPSRSAPTSFVIGAVEVYRTYDYAYIDVGRNYTVDVSGAKTANLTSASSGMDKSIQLFAGEKIDLLITMTDTTNEKIQVLENGVDITNTLVSVSPGVFSLSGIGADEFVDIKVMNVPRPEAYVTGPTYLYADDQTATYSFWVSNMPEEVGAISMTFSVEDAYFNRQSFSALNGWSITDDSGWVADGLGFWEREVTLTYAGGNNNSEYGFYQTVLAVKDNVSGVTEVKIVSIEAATPAGVFAFSIAPPTSINVSNFLRYDVNRDGKVDLADVAAAAYFFMAFDSDADWDTLKEFQKFGSDPPESYFSSPERCDVNDDKVVDIEDMILIMANYT